jgi:hypothetical protein
MRCGAPSNTCSEHTERAQSGSGEGGGHERVAEAIRLAQGRSNPDGPSLLCADSPSYFSSWTVYAQLTGRLRRRRHCRPQAESNVPFEAVPASPDYCFPFKYRSNHATVRSIASI